MSLCLPVTYSDSLKEKGASVACRELRARDPTQISPCRFYDPPRTHRLPEMYVLPLRRRDIMFSTCERRERKRGWRVDQRNAAAKKKKRGGGSVETGLKAVLVGNAVLV